MGINPSSAELEGYIAAAAAKRGIPLEVAKATAKTESDYLQFDALGNTVTNGADWGIMQINQDAHPQLNWDRVKNDWKYNVDSGMDILQGAYNAAVRAEPKTGIDPRLGAYSGYNAGDSNVDRWNWTTVNGWAQELDENSNGIDDRDERYNANLAEVNGGAPIEIGVAGKNKGLLGNVAIGATSGLLLGLSLLVGVGLLVYVLLRDNGGQDIGKFVVDNAMKLGGAIK